MNYYYRHIGDYIRDTSHLSLLEHGIYTRLMDLYYITEQPLDDSTVVRLVGARTEDERKALEAVLNDFFELSGGLWSQRRCEAEIAAYKEKAKTNQENGKLGGRPKTTQPKPTGNPDGSQTTSEPNPNQEPITNNQEPKREKRPRKARATPLPEGFQLSARVEEWAREKGFYAFDLAQQFEAFVSYAKRKGATYADWDEALMTAIREDWAKARGKTTSQPLSFRERDEAAAAEKYRRWTGQADPLDVIDMEQTHGPLIANG